jgi:hypothetical protein
MTSRKHVESGLNPDTRYTRTVVALDQEDGQENVALGVSGQRIVGVDDGLGALSRSESRGNLEGNRLGRRKGYDGQGCRRVGIPTAFS